MIVIDPGHGGDRASGSSTPFGARGRLLDEKDLVLDIAQRIRARAPNTVHLTRDRDHNVSLAERIRIARALAATTFVSLHAGGADAGVEAWIHPSAGTSSCALGARLAAVFGGMVLRGPLAVLDPRHHGPGCASCLVEIGRFGAAEEPRLADPWFRDHVAESIVRTISVDRDATGQPIIHETRRERFDIWHEVPLVQQLTGMSCWAAAAAMLVGWRDCIDIDAEDVAHGAGRWQDYRDGLEPGDVTGFARAWGLEVAILRDVSVSELRRLLASYGPLWVGEASPGLHVVVVAGVHGDGTVDGTFVRVADPWPIGRGERYTLSFREFRENLLSAAALAGGHPQVLHVARGARRASAQEPLQGVA